MKKYDLAVYIGRFQPFHNGHLSVINKAKEVADHILVLVGSANTSISAKNPWTYAEREEMLLNSVGDIQVEPLDDYVYEENQWLANVQYEINNALDLTKKDSKVCLIGHAKDESSYYLNHFPQYDLVDVEYHEVIDATQIRDLYFHNQTAFIHGAVPKAVYDFIVDWKTTNTFENLTKEFFFIEEYRASWANSPFPPTFNTVDAVVIQSGHILIGKRKYAPGKGLWCIPGGFINPTESQEDAMLRELREETKLKVPLPVLRGSIVKEKTFSDPKRSSRGRTFTQAYLIQLDDNQELPKVKGSDDLSDAKFVTLAEFYDMPEEIYEDHYHIVRKLLDNM